MGTDMSECVSAMPGDWISTKAEWTGWGENILTLAVLSILITAPLGAISILALGPKLLEADPTRTEDSSSEMLKAHTRQNSNDFNVSLSNIDGYKSSYQEDLLSTQILMQIPF